MEKNKMNKHVIDTLNKYEDGPDFFKLIIINIKINFN